MDQISDALLNITLRQFQVFVVVADAGGFGLAADRLDIAQPSVSAHIHSLEAELGVVLFKRVSGRRPVMTEAGHILLEHARRALTEVSELQKRLAPRPARAEEIVLACQRSLAHSVLPLALAQFANQHPEIQLVTRIGTQEEVTANIESGLADIACFLGNEDLLHLGSRAIGAERFIVVAPPDHPLVGRTGLTAAKIAAYPFVGPPQGTILGRILDQLLADAGMPPVNMVSRATEHQMLKELVLAGVGLACCSARSARPELAAGRLMALDWEARPMMVGIRLATCRMRPLSLTAQRLAACIEASCRTSVPA